MNLSHSILALLAAPVVICSAGYAEAAPEAIAGYLPSNGGTLAGSVIRPVRDASFVELHRAAIQRFAQLPKDIATVEAYADKRNVKSQSILKYLGLTAMGESKNGNMFHFKGLYSNLLDRYK